MIKVELIDFEKYRPNLLRYASGLLRTKGFGNNKTGELDELAKDIVQNTYLSFHDCNKDAFVTESHLENFLKLVLYRRYSDSLKNTHGIGRYTNKKLGDIDYLDEGKHPFTQSEIDETNVFKALLSDDEQITLDYLLEGFNQKEIAKKMKIGVYAVSVLVKSMKDRYLGTKVSDKVIEETRVAKIVLNSQKPIKQIDHNGVVVKVWDAAVIAAQELDLAASAISNCCKGKRKTHGGFSWSYK